MEGARDTGGRIRVLLVDDRTVFRRMLARMLYPHGGMAVVGEIPNDERALRVSREARPDVIVTGTWMPFERAREALSRVRSVSPSLGVVVVTMFENPHEPLQPEAGAYPAERVPAERLDYAVRAAVSNPKGEYVVVDMPRETEHRTTKQRVFE
jgi:DNA-binding NarL/FixJ family response regulator